LDSPLRFVGGKAHLLKYILPFPFHNTYLELFGGSAIVLLNKPSSDSETYNDINGRLVNFWNTLRDSFELLRVRCEHQLWSRANFEKCLEHSESEIEDAFRFFYINSHSHSGNNKDYKGIHFTRPSNYIAVYHNSLKRFDEVYKRIRFVNFECQDFAVLLNRFLARENNEMVVYADPPYFNGGEVYEKTTGGVNWSASRARELGEILRQFEKAKIVVSIDDENYLPWKNKKKVARVNRVPMQLTNRDYEMYEYVFKNFDEREKANNVCNKRVAFRSAFRPRRFV